MIQAQIIGDHAEGSNKRNSDRGERTGLAVNITNQHRGKHPGEVAGEVGKADQQRHLKELGAIRIGVIIVTKRKASQNTGVFHKITDDQTKDKKGENAAPFVAQGSMKQPKNDREQNPDRRGNMEWKHWIHPKRRRMPLPFQAWGGMRRSFVGGLGGIRRRHALICSCIVDSQMKTMV
ncbi:hypothetical protein Krac_4534 [Ktedonobacter racemifer DSM 44963]|uniref:Uncharacterized protein n=1 Tax=Ktedonobacter racemifer DSM 44963 TaxID=485913 RepID=D6TT00_KTERA|nr:hypothetical protein [Ktedonobacter racemifer]EFH83551.1 hypothetical protein Krac_4534 [Ktedonobacter racemifer DSM 44963]